VDGSRLGNPGDRSGVDCSAFAEDVQLLPARDLKPKPL
jgi:hypothetical protein